MGEKICRYFRARSMYVPGQENAAMPADADSHSVSHCWCNRTMTEAGLDDELVEPSACSSPERACYEAS